MTEGYVCVADTSVTHTEQELERCGECLPRPDPMDVLEGQAARPCATSCVYGDDVGVPGVSPPCAYHEGYMKHLGVAE